MEQEASQKKKNSVVVEPMDHGAVTVFWSDIEAAVYASMPGADEVTFANVAGLIRKRVLQPWAIWKDGTVRAILITGPVSDGYSGNRAVMVHAFHGHLDDDEWVESERQLEIILTERKFTKIVSWTDNPRVVELCKLFGWGTRTVCVKELFHG